MNDHILYNSFSDDKLKGAKAISAFIDEPLRRTNYLLERGLIPAGKVGNQWIASKRRLTEHYQQLTSGNAA